MLFIKNKDMKVPEPLSNAVKNAIKSGYEVLLKINGEYYELGETFKRGFKKTV